MERRQDNRRLYRREKLTTALLVKISIWAISIVIIASAITFLTTYSNARERVITVLKRDLAPTLERNQALFNRIESNADILTEKFLNQYEIARATEGLAHQFDEWYEETSPGVVRLKPEFYRGITTYSRYFENLSAFLGPRENPINDEFKIRVLAAQHALNELGPAWQKDVANTHFSMPENALLIYSVDSPWGLLADKDLVITDFSVVKSTLQSENPDRAPNWTGLYYDISADVWTITYQKPIDLNGQHLATASFDVALSSLLSDLTEKKRPESEHIVLNTKGDLIAASNLTQEAIVERSTLTSETYAEPLYQQLSHLVTRENWTSQSFILEDEIEGQLLIVDKIAGPNWWHITAYPLSEIRKQAVDLPIRLVAAGVGLVILILLMTYWLIQREISKPLHEVATVASLMGQRNYQKALSHRAASIKARGEVKQALDAFKTMAARFISAQTELEQQVESRTAELAEANKQLDALAHMDGLTGLFNRRAFDKDLSAATESGKSYYLMMADIDEFKPYNDNYGHEAGDRALKRIADCLRDKTPLKVYRYGGEEFAIIIPAAEPIEQKLNELREAIVELAITHEYKQAKPPVLTLSMGAAPLKAKEAAAGTIRWADRQLYKAKSAGRNCVCVE
ncbi:diguanylate cyclase domain-containing protein [Idiomarina loihiensis]|uniref:diguanylate cyclase domain-containing protein n=1 Tax=Idiomarina loihiensis TaxID=135577 RepID=UPI00384BFA3B